MQYQYLFFLKLYWVSYITCLGPLGPLGFLFKQILSYIVTNRNKVCQVQ